MVKNREAIYEHAASTIRESASYFIGSTYNPDVTLPQTLAYYDAMQEEICKYKERAKEDKDDMVKCPESIVRRALTFVDEVIIAIGINEQKHSLFPVEKREQMIRDFYKDEPRVKVMSYSNLTVDFAHEVGANTIIRGIRTVKDFEYEATG